MKTHGKFAPTLLLVVAISFAGFSGTATAQTPGPLPKNLVAGVTGPGTSNAIWNGYSSQTLIPGATLFPVTSPNTVLYLGFTAGTTADISNMVIYKTARGSTKITGVTAVKLGGVSNPSINLTSNTVCPVQPISVTNPCVIRFDPTVLALSALSDYYFVVFFTNDTNNQTVGAAVSNSTKTSLSGGYTNGVDLTHLTVGQSLPSPVTVQLDFLMYVMTS